MICSNCQYDAADAVVCPNCGYAVVGATPPGAPETPTSGPVVWDLEKSGFFGGCFVAIFFNFIVFFVGATAMSQGYAFACTVSRIILGVLITISLVIIGLVIWRGSKASDFWATFAFGVFVPFLPCSMAFVSQMTHCPGR